MALEELRLSGDKKTLTVISNGISYPLPADRPRPADGNPSVEGKRFPWH